jgi:hypothetical protein
MDVQEGEENALIDLLVDVGFPTRVHVQHLSGLLLFFWFCSFATHDEILIPIVAEPKTSETATPTFRFLKRTKLPGFGKLVLSEVDMDLVVDSKYQDTLRYRLYDTGKLQQKEEMRAEMRRRR